jgi:hypothetical protein
LKAVALERIPIGKGYMNAQVSVNREKPDLTFAHVPLRRVSLSMSGSGRVMIAAEEIVGPG